MKKSLRKLRYASYFALLDAFPISIYGRSAGERLKSFWVSLRACFSAILNVATITILIVTITIVAGLYSGTVSWLRDFVENNQLARTVEVSSTFGVQVEVFNEDTLAKLRSLDPAVEAVHGWNDVTFWFYDRSGSKDDTLTHGRTVDPEDPLLDGLVFVDGLQGGGIFRDQGIAQVIVSLPLLASLGYDREGSFPQQIDLDYHGSQAAVEVVGICEKTPAGDFLMTEPFNRAIQDRQWDPSPRFPGVYLGPLSDPEAVSHSLAALDTYLQAPRVAMTAEVVRRAGTELWIHFTRSAPAWTRKQWEDIFLPVAYRRLGEAAQGWRHEFSDPLAPEHAERDSLAVVYTRASLYVRDLQAVPRVADMLAASGYQVSSNSKELALLFLQISSLGRGILAAVILVVGSLTAVSIVLSFTQTIQRKTPEIAILKAFGTSNAIVLGVYLMQAVLLWLLSLLLSGIVVSRTAAVVNAQLFQLLRLQGALNVGASGANLITLSHGILLSVAGGSLALCCLATALASLVATSLQPASALNLQR